MEVIFPAEYKVLAAVFVLIILITLNLRVFTSALLITVIYCHVDMGVVHIFFLQNGYYLQ
jgi:hypothetical protein